MVREIYKASERSAGLTRQLLAFSRQQISNPEVLDLNRIVANTEIMLKRLIGEDIHIKIISASALWRVKADPGQIEQVLMNLAVNARDAMPTGGQLTIQTGMVDLDQEFVRCHHGARLGPHVVLVVSDTGCGMTPEVKSRIFEPFFTTKRPGKGTGLGLSTVFGIVHQSGGVLNVWSEFGVGTIFKVYLPRADEPAVEPTISVEASLSLEGRETILVVEDDDQVRNLARLMLTRCGYTVLESATAVEGVQMAATYAGPIRLLITDVVMPGGGGRIVADRIKATRPELRVLFVSGYMDDAVIRHGVRSDQMNFLQKPFSSDMLARKVKELLHMN
jgi:CheY-like chemotaxis protein